MTTTDVPLSGGSLVSEGWWVQDDQVAATIDMHRLRELTAVLGFMPATTDATDIERRGGAVAVATLIMGADYDAGWPSYESAKSDGSCPSVAEAVTVARPGVDAGPHIRGPHFRYEGRSGSDAGRACCRCSGARRRRPLVWESWWRARLLWSRPLECSSGSCLRWKSSGRSTC